MPFRLLLSVLAILVGAPAALAGQDDPDPLRIHFLDVGQGDATLIEVPTGQRVLIDAGPDDGIVDHLLRLGIDTLDLLIASHNHADHIGGAASVVRRFPVRFFMDNGVAHTTATYRTMLEALVEREVPLLEPERREIEVGDATLEILPPPGAEELGHNDNSVGVVLRFGEFRAMMAGDAEAHLWRHWLETLPEALGPVEVHKASHHGSRNGDVGDVLERLLPQLVVVSAAPDNPYGHPHPEALALYAAIETEVLLTAENGTIVVSAWEDGSFDAAHVLRLRRTRPFGSLHGLPRVDGIAAARLGRIEDEGRACVQ